MADRALPEARISELLELAERAASTALTGDYEPVAGELRRADAELETAILQLLAARRTADAMKLIVGAHSHWIDAGRAADGQRLAETALAEADGVGAIDAVLRNRTMLTASETAFRQGDQESATTWAAAAIESAAADDPVTAALAEVSLARIAFRDGDAPRIESLSRAALERAGEDLKVQRAAYHMLAWAAHTAGDRNAALDWFERSLAVRQAMADPFGVAVELANLGDMAMEAGDLPRAAASIREALATAVRLDNLYLLTSLIGSAGALSGAVGDAEEALTLLAAAETAYATTSLVPDPGGREMLDAAAASARQAVTPSRADAATATGNRLSVQAAARRAMKTCERLMKRA